MTARPSFNPSGSNVGIAQLPGFDESLRLLVNRERYSLTDIAMMFGVGRERIRQLCERRGLHFPDDTARGLMAVRVWDDSAHRFWPVSRGTLTENKAKSVMARRRARRDERRAQRQAHITEVVVALRQRLKRDPSFAEMYEALTGKPHVRQAVPLVLGLWDTSSRPTRAKLRDFRERTGIAARRLGWAGHTQPRVRSVRKQYCRRGHTDFRATPSGDRYCATCRRDSDRARRKSVSCPPHSDTLRKP